jgi:Protein of unknown function (DUF992)
MRWYQPAALIAIILAPGVHGVASASTQGIRTDIGVLMCGLTYRKQTPSAAAAVALRQTRDILCVFRPTSSGPEETYTGTLESIGLEKELFENRAMIWIVKGLRGTVWSPGLLQQNYAADPSANPVHSPPLYGENDVSIVLQTMADPKIPASADNRQQATIAAVVLVTLRLKSTPA